MSEQEFATTNFEEKGWSVVQNVVIYMSTPFIAGTPEAEQARLDEEELAKLNQ